MPSRPNALKVMMVREGYRDDHFFFAREGTDPMYRLVTWTIEMNILVNQRL